MQQVFRRMGWRLSRCRSLAETAEDLAKYAVIISEVAPPDGDWKDGLSRLSQLGLPADLIVTAQQAYGTLWAEVMVLGGHDASARPLEPQEAVRVLECSA